MSSWQSSRSPARKRPPSSIDLLDPAPPDRIDDALSERGLYCDVRVNSAGFGACSDREPKPRPGIN
jgi:short-subunit dehydrogenase